MPRFTVFGTLGVATKVYARNFISFTVLAAVVYSPLIAYAIWGIVRANAAPSAEEADERGAIVVLVVFGGTYFLSKALAGALAYGVFNHMRGTPASIGACIGNGVKRLVPVFFTAILVAIVIGVGSLTYVLPGLIAASLAYVAVPAAVIEHTGPWSSFTRSVRLVDKAVPRVFGLIVVFIALQIGGYWALNLLLDSLIPAGTTRVIPHLVLTMLFGALDAVLSSVAYAHLRMDRDGVETTELARVFD